MNRLAGQHMHIYGVTCILPQCVLLFFGSLALFPRSHTLLFDAAN